MTTEGLLSLCHALKKLEAAAVTALRPTQVPRLRLRLTSGPANRCRPQLITLQLKKKPVQTEFDWPNDQLQLFGRRAAG